jgi:3-dehydroquinate synthase
MKNDKKMIAGKIKFILLDGIGNAVIDKTVTDAEMAEALKYLKK